MFYSNKNKETAEYRLSKLKNLHYTIKKNSDMLKIGSINCTLEIETNTCIKNVLQ